ncbi:50S ribosomal protein L2 [Candidatus Dojkabacteria bacterium]|nr:50S ribosomal protein L2 [Candidatus Dojkabacteria bacterium]
MALKKYKPKTPSLRHTVLVDTRALAKKRPMKSLVQAVDYKAGRRKGRITVRHKGGRVKRLYRVIDFKREKIDVPATVESIEYDPNRSSNIALLKYKDGERRYILAPAGLKEGSQVISGEDVPVKVGNATKLKNIQSGIKVHNVELKAGGGGKLCRSAGNSALVMGGDKNYVQLRMPSGEIRLVHEDCYATIGEVGNVDHGNVKLGKAGRKRRLGIRPTVRGQVMGAQEHPHGGGEAKHRVGGQRKSIYGHRMGVKTRKTKRTNKYIIKRRTTKRRSKVKKLK